MNPSKSSIKNSYYPLFLDVAQKPCIVLGGGKVAERKVKMLLKFDAMVKLISPDVTNALRLLAQKGKINIVRRGYRTTDLRNVSLIFAATDNEKMNNKIRDDARRRNIPVNVVDNPDLCDFIVPSIIKKGPLVIAISTSGVLPLLSKKLRKEIDSIVTKDYIQYADIVGKFRKYIINSIEDKKTRRDIMKRIGRMSMEDLNNMGLKEIKRMFLQSDI
ncbi:MAG: bifunctional precorrin-2 dehydrogenase/sirohydrochlorin ferrochelatase [Syntrophorhabdaceae bacterium]|nr:bifunctional precorrin-2 dehydrogenase/sirohydrochlorin ferrochelatase [Syntrophorhabdaceae bacterium]MDD5244865.1 bifunctional precorrin-2 dehydrogenase/sirohydrochlorin ferrochelatase [Syntrophorhabdaceae bacterium]